MGKRRYIPLWVLVICMLFSTTLHAHTTLKYANHLYEQRDYFRAISAYKEIAFHADYPGLKQVAYSRIAYAYYHSGKYNSANYYVRHLLGQFSLNDSLRNEICIIGGLTAYQLEDYPRALRYFQQSRSGHTSGRSFAYTGLVHAALAQMDSADWYFTRIPTEDDALFNVQAKDDIRQLLMHRRTDRRKSPMLAAGMSALLPGAGQVYSNHYYDALQAAGFVLGFAYASYLAYRYEKSEGGPYIRTGIGIGVTGIFHLGNILGAYRTAQYRNYRQRETFLRRLQNLILPS